MSQIREARPQDVPAVLAMVRELAEYEREPDAVRMSEEQLAELTRLAGEWNASPPKDIQAK